MGTESTALDLEELLSHRGWVRGLAVQLVGEGQGEDLAQDTMLAALEHRPEARRGGVGLKAWLRSVARRLALQRRRGDARRASREAWAAKSVVEAEESSDLERAEPIELLVREVIRLPEPDRRVVLLRSFDRFSFEQIAQRTASSPEAVRKRHGRALERLRRQLEERYGGREAWLSAFLPWTLDGTGALPGSPSPPISTIPIHGGLSVHWTHPLTWITAASVALIGTLTWIDPGAPPAVAPSVTPSGGSPTRNGDASLARLEASTVRTEAAAPLGSSSGKPAGPEEPVDQDPRTGVRVQVVSKASGEVCPGARVRYLPLDATDPAEIAASMKSTTDMRTPMERFGVSFQADGEGMVTIPVEVGHASISGEWKGLYEFAHVPAETVGVYRLELREVRTIEVLVLDWRGNTVEGLPVELATPRSGARGRLWAGTTDEAGVALVDDLDIALSRSKDGEALELFAHVAAEQPVVLQLERDRIAKAYTLQLGRTGALEVELVEADGEPFGQGAELVVTALPPTDSEDPDSARLRERVTSSAPFVDGIARIPCLATGTRFEVLVIPELGSGSRRWEIEGPSRPGEVRSIRLAYDVPTTRIRIPLESATGAALSHRTVKVRSIRYTAIGHWIDHGVATTDATGALELEVNRRAVRGVVGRELELEVVASAEPIAEGARGLAVQPLPLDLEGKHHEAGPLRVTPWPVLVSGRVVDSEGQAVSGAIVQVTALIPRGRAAHGGARPDSEYTPQYEFQARSDETGRFRIEGRCLWTQLRAEVRLDGSTFAPVEFEAGASDLVMRMDS